MSDEKGLIEDLKSGNHGAFKKLVESHKEMVFQVCYNFLNSADDADDIAQDVFVEVYKSVANFHGKSTLKTWLYRIAVNKSLNFIKKHKRRTLVDDFSSFNNDSLKTNDASEYIESKERKKILNSAIASLAKNQKIAFTLQKIDDKSYKEVAEIMDISISSVESLMYRAKKNLQKKLLNYYKTM
ncbi:MAG: RNA polymerase sigma factor [Bacteroidota bacterium]|nr:RNA polymerase sigma factor [Bacteroidota bacterium]